MITMTAPQVRRLPPWSRRLTQRCRSGRGRPELPGRLKLRILEEYEQLAKSERFGSAIVRRPAVVVIIEMAPLGQSSIGRERSVGGHQDDHNVCFGHRPVGDPRRSGLSAVDPPPGRLNPAADISEQNYRDLGLQSVGKTLKKRGRKPGSTTTGAAAAPRRRRNSKRPATA